MDARVPDDAVRQQKYEELQQMIWDEEAMIWPYYSVAIFGVRDSVQNYEARGDYYVLLGDVSLS